MKKGKRSKDRSEETVSNRGEKKRGPGEGEDMFRTVLMRKMHDVRWTKR